MRLIGALGAIEEPELRATFNGGLGMVVIVPPDGVAATIAELATAGFPAWLVGEVAPVADLGGRYLEAPLRAASLTGPAAADGPAPRAANGPAPGAAAG
jgi:hypothetical protein